MVISQQVRQSIGKGLRLPTFMRFNDVFTVTGGYTHDICQCEDRGRVSKVDQRS